MDNIKRYLGLIILLGILGAGVYTFFLKKEETRKITYNTSDAKNLKGVISIALDSWIGYFPFRSPVFGQLMRDAGYRLKIIDDNADYGDRMKSLKSRCRCYGYRRIKGGRRHRLLDAESKQH